MRHLFLLSCLIVASMAMAQSFPSSDLGCIHPCEEIEGYDINKRNLLFFYLPSSNELMFQGRSFEVLNTRKTVKKYIENAANDHDLPKVLRWPRTGGEDMFYTEYVIMLRKAPSVSAESTLLRQTLHEIVEAISEMRGIYALRYYNKSYMNLNQFEKQVIDEMLPCTVYYGDYVYMAPPPPPAPISSLTDEDIVFIVVEQMPEFVGGQDSLFSYLSHNVQYPVIAKENGIQGRVICQFVVNTDGTIVDVEVVRTGGDASLDREAVRVISSMPKWIPGKQKGTPVRVKYTVPVNFSLK